MASQRRLSMDKFFRQNHPTERPRRASYNEAIHTGLISDSQNMGNSESKTKLTKEDIGLPTNFRHLTHVGWDSIVGSPPKSDYISSPSNFQHLTHISQPNPTTVKSSSSNDYISSPTNFQHLTHITWDPMRSAPSNGLLTSKRRWEKFINALIHHGDNEEYIDSLDKEKSGRGRTRTNEMQEVASTSKDCKAEVETKEMVHSVPPVNRRFY